MIARSQVIGCGAYLPQQVVTNADLACRLQTSDEWIRQRTGIEERRFARRVVCQEPRCFDGAHNAVITIDRDNVRGAQSRAKAVVGAQLKLGLEEIPSTLRGCDRVQQVIEARFVLDIVGR